MPYEIYHHGVKGQKWGVRRYQNKDGSLTKLGKKRIEEGATLFPTYKGKNLGWKSERSMNRDTAVEKIDNDLYEELKLAKENTQDTVMINKRYGKRFLDEYGTATLKDLGIEPSPEAKKFVTDAILANKSYEAFGRID